MEIAIIGLPASGKSTLFNALTGSGSNPAAEGPLVGVAKIADPRIGALAEIFRPRRVVAAEMTFHDLPPAREERVQRAISGKQLNLLQRADALLIVVRMFEDDSVPHVMGNVDPHRDVEAMIGELALSDLVILEKRVERIKDQLKGVKASTRAAFSKEMASLDRIKDDLEQEVPIREQPLSDAETRLIAHYQFLTAKPLLLVFNVGESMLDSALSHEAKLADRYGRNGVTVAVVSARLEAELLEMEATERKEYRESMDASEVSIDQMLHKAQELLGMVSFFTVGPDEVRAWMVPRGTFAPRAAGTIHTDIERGFIRAEVVPFDPMVKYRSIAEAKRQGVFRLEGKDYLVQDGDVITFLFNV